MCVLAKMQNASPPNTGEKGLEVSSDSLPERNDPIVVFFLGLQCSCSSVLLQ